MTTTRKSRRRTSAPARKRAQPQQEEKAFELRPSEIQGTGVFATRWIRKGEKIVEYTGERISNAEADRRYDDEKMRRHHTFLFILTSRTVIDGGAGGNEAKYINHSCDPNCEAVIYDGKRIWIEAIRDIAPGEELAYDYQYERTDEHTEEDEEFYACRCGAAICRGTILAPPKQTKKKRHAPVKSGARKKKGSSRRAGLRKEGSSKRAGSASRSRR